MQWTIIAIIFNVDRFCWPVRFSFDSSLLSLFYFVTIANFWLIFFWRTSAIRDLNEYNLLSLDWTGLDNIVKSSANCRSAWLIYYHMIQLELLPSRRRYMLVFLTPSVQRKYLVMCLVYQYLYEKWRKLRSSGRKSWWWRILYVRWTKLNRNRYKLNRTSL